MDCFGPEEARAARELQAEMFAHATKRGALVRSEEQNG